MGRYCFCIGIMLRLMGPLINFFGCTVFSLITAADFNKNFAWRLNRKVENFEIRF